MTLPEFIKSVGGDEAAAALFGVKRRTILSWRLGSRSPRPEAAARIYELSQGQVTPTEIYAARKAA